MLRFAVIRLHSRLILVFGGYEARAVCVPAGGRWNAMRIMADSAFVESLQDSVFRNGKPRVARFALTLGYRMFKPFGLCV